MNFTYKTLLRLDSICQFLTQGERSIVIKLMLHHEGEHNDKMAKALRLINQHNWEPPEMVIKQDRLTYYYDTATQSWQPIENYKHPILTEIQKLK